MSRSFSTRALVLRARPSGESNREISFLVPGEGILRATVFGGPKSRLRAHAAPYHEGTAWFYRDPVKDFLKVTDFDVYAWRPGIRESYGRSMAAASLAETVLAFQGGGAWEEALDLSSAALDALEKAADGEERRITALFFWSWADVLGIRPDPSRCASCGREADPRETLFYSRREEQIFCADCGGTDSPPGEGPADLLPLPAGTRRWLEAAGNAGAAHWNRYSLEKSLDPGARAFVTAILSAALGRRLPTWDW